VRHQGIRKEGEHSPYILYLYRQQANKKSIVAHTGSSHMLNAVSKNQQKCCETLKTDSCIMETTENR